MKLVIGEKGMIQSPMVPVRWCLNKGTLKELAEKKVRKPYILIAVLSKRTGLEDRYLVPLDQIVEYVQFKTSGVHIIHAAIVWTDDDCHLKKLVFKKDEDVGYLVHLSYFFSSHRFGVLYEQAGKISVEVDVPSDIFAQKRPEWVEKWVNFPYENPPGNECEFRKRMLLSVVATPLVLFAMIASKVGMAGYTIAKRFLMLFYCFSLGFLPLNIKPLFQPFKARDWQIAEKARSSVFVKEWRDKKGNLHRSYHLFPFSPFVLLFGFAVSWLVAPLFGGSSNLVGAISTTLVVASFLSIFLSLLTLGIYLISNYILPDEEVLADADFQALLCEEVTSAKLEDLPPEKRIIKLRIKDIKAKICRPFEPFAR